MLLIFFSHLLRIGSIALMSHFRKIHKIEEHIIKSVCAIIFSKRKKCIVSNVLNLPVPFLYSEPNLLCVFFHISKFWHNCWSCFISLLKNMLEFSIIVVWASGSQDVISMIGVRRVLHGLCYFVFLFETTFLLPFTGRSCASIFTEDL